MVGKNEAMAGRSMPGSVRSTIFAIAISAPVLPAETIAAASPLWTASMARRMEDLRPARSAWLGLSSIFTSVSAWRTVLTALKPGSRSIIGLRRCSSPKNRKCAVGNR